MRRSIERVTYYDPPDRIYQNLIVSEGWPYRYNEEYFRARDMALQVCLYIGCLRITELVGGQVQTTLVDDKGDKKTHYMMLPPITRDQFLVEDGEIWLREAKNIKQNFVKLGGRWVPIVRAQDYPDRVEIPFFKTGPTEKLTELLEDHLDTLGSTDPVFDIGRNRAYKIITCYGVWPHYYKDMGLKWWKRYFKNDSFKLKRFSGHKKWASLEKYMGEELY